MTLHAREIAMRRRIPFPNQHIVRWMQVFVGSSSSSSLVHTTDTASASHALVYLSLAADAVVPPVCPSPVAVTVAARARHRSFACLPVPVTARLTFFFFFCILCLVHFFKDLDSVECSCFSKKKYSYIYMSCFFNWQLISLFSLVESEPWKVIKLVPTAHLIRHINCLHTNHLWLYIPVNCTWLLCAS